MSITPTHVTRRLRRNAIASAMALALAGAGTVVYSPSASAQQSGPAAQQFRIPAGSLREALDALATQGNVSVMYSPELVAGKSTKGVSGRYTPVEAMRRLLAGSGLVGDLVGGTTFVLKRAPASQTPAPAKPRTSNNAASVEEEVKNMPAIMVTGTKTLNMDIMRTEDDPQPYVVFDREQIERSGATSLEQFLQQRLTMNASTANTGSSAIGSGAFTSQIKLRGLSAAQTLILIDGRRASSPAYSSAGVGALSQTEITGIPLAAIERIEVLPTTATGIYGGSATGGAINIIMRRDYDGGEVRLGYENTFNTDSAAHKVDLIFGHHFSEGRTSLLLSASSSNANDLLVGDRDLMQRGRNSLRNNDPSFFLPPNLPPLGFTPNIASVDGTGLVLKESGIPLGASFTSVPAGYAGISTDAGQALIKNAGIYNWDLANSAQVGGGGGGRRLALFTQPSVKSGALVLRHDVSDGLQLFSDLSFSETVNRFSSGGFTSTYYIPASSDSNPFMQDIYAEIPLPGNDSKRATTIEHSRALVGLIKKLKDDWQLGVDYTRDKTIITYSNDNATPGLANALITGELDLLRDTNAFPVDIDQYMGQSLRTSPFESTMRDVNIRASGSLWSGPGGSAVLTTSLAYRKEEIPSSFVVYPAYNFNYYYPDRSQSVKSAYLELRIPLFSEKNSRPGVRALDLQVAARRDSYRSESGEVVRLLGGLPAAVPDVLRGQNKFNSTDPTIALRWSPVEWLVLRASYGTGFLPPALNQLVTTTSPSLQSYGTDPLRGNRPAGPYTYLSGGNQNLMPERSKSLSAGIIVTPAWMNGLRLSIDYTKIEKTDNIATHPLGPQGLINDEQNFPDRVVRGENLPDDPPGWAGPIVLLNNSYLNLSRAELEAWDVQLDYSKEFGDLGALEFFFMGTWQPHFRVQAIDGQPVIENAGVSFTNPLKFKASGGILWTSARGWKFGWNVSHFDSYLVESRDVGEPYFSTGQGRGGVVPSQTYHDFYASYDFGFSKARIARMMPGARLTFGVRNIFEKKPPLDVANSLGFYSQYGDPRLSTYYMSIRVPFGGQN